MTSSAVAIVQSDIFPVFGKSPQLESLYRPQVNALSLIISDIEIIVQLFEDELDIIQSEITAVLADIAILNSTVISQFSVQTTYTCVGDPVVDLFDTPTVGPPTSVIFNSRALASDDESVLISYDSVCGYVNLQTNWSTVSLNSVGSGLSIVLVGFDVGPALETRSLVSTNGSVTITAVGADEIDLVSTTGGAVSLTSFGSGESIVFSGAGPNMVTKDLLATTGITLNDNILTSEITISAAAVVLNSAGSGLSFVVDGTGPTFSIKTLLAGSNVTFAPSGSELQIVGPGTSSLTSAGGSESLVYGLGTGPALSIKGLTSSGAVTLDDSSGLYILISSAVTSLTTAGSGASLIGSTPMSVKTLTAGSNLAFAVTADNIEISTITPISLSSAGGAETLISSGSGPSLAIKGLTAGPGITLTSGVSSITITPVVITLVTSGSGTTLISDGVGPALALKSLLGSGAVTLSSTSTEITITKVPTTLSSAGGIVSLVSSGIGPTLGLLGLIAGSGATLTSTTTTVTIATTAVSLASAGGTVSLVSSGIAPNLTIKSIVPGIGLIMTDNGSDLELSVPVPNINTLGSGAVYVVNGTGPAMTIRSIVNGTGISLSGTTGLTIAGTTTLTTPGGSQTMSIIPTGSGTNLALSSLIAGSGISLVDSGTDITINSTVVVTLASRAGADVSLVVDGTGPTLSIKGLTEGNGIDLVSNTNDITLDLIQLGLFGTGPIPIYSVNGGPNLEVKGLDAGPSISLTDNVTSVTVANTFYNTAYGQLTAPSFTPLTLSSVSTLITPGATAYNLVNFIQSSDGVLQYSGEMSRYIFIQCSISISPTDLTDYFTFQLLKNGATTLDTRNTFTLGSNEVITLQALVLMDTNDTIGVYANHSGVSGTIGTTMAMYDFVCRHYTFVNETVHVTGAWTGPSFSQAGSSTNAFTWDTMYNSNPDVSITLPGTTFTILTTRRYLIGIACNSVQGTLSFDLQINGTIVYTCPPITNNDTSVSHVYQYQFAAVLNSGSTLRVMITNISTGSRAVRYPVVYIISMDPYP